jgi:DNA-directed RNA polymerase subunit L
MSEFVSNAIGEIVKSGLEAVTSSVPTFVKKLMGGEIVAEGPLLTGGSGPVVGDGDGEVEDMDTDASAGTKPKKNRAKGGVAVASAAVSAQMKSKKSSVASAAAAAAAAATTSSTTASSGAHINAHSFAKITHMRPIKNALHFTLENAPTSTANALRRIILSDIPTLVFRTFPHEANLAKFHVNTTRHHNEILKQRLSCIPIHISDPEFVHANHYVEIHVVNKEARVIYVTTKDFIMKDKGTNAEIKAWKGREIFPPDPDTGDYIEFARLMPKVASYNEGEELHITADLDMGFAKQDSAFNVCCTCAYGCTQDKQKQSDAWEKIVADQQKTAASGSSGGNHDETLRLQKQNWELLDAQRIVVPNSFDFAIETLGVFKNEELLRKACDIMNIKCEAFIASIEAAAERNIVPADVTMPNAYNVILRREDYTLGKSLEYMLYIKHYLGDRSLTFCAFKKAHPHDEDSYIQLAFEDATDDMVASVGAIAVNAARDIMAIFENLKTQF